MKVIFAGLVVFSAAWIAASARAALPPGVVAPVLGAGGAGSVTAVQPDGRILADNGTVRFNADGSPDPAYHMSGPGCGQSSGAQGVAVTANGTIYVVESAVPSPVVKAYHPDGSSAGGVLAIGASGVIALANNQVLVWASNGSVTVPAHAQIGAQNLVKLNADGTVDDTFNVGAGTNFQIEAAAVAPGGSVYVGGLFSSFDHIPDHGVIRLNADGTVDAAFNPQLDDPYPTALLPLRSGNVLLYDDHAHELFELAPTGATLRDWGGTSGLGEIVRGLTQAGDGSIYVTGGFSSLAGVSATDVVKLTEDGVVDPSFQVLATLSAMRTTSEAEIAGLTVLPDGHRLLLNNGPDGLVALNADGSPDTGFFQVQPGPGAVYAISHGPDGRTFVAGCFLSVNGAPRPGLAAFLPDGTLDPAFVPTVGLGWPGTGQWSTFVASGAALPPASIAVAGDGSVYVTGSLNGAILRFLPDGTLDPTFAAPLSAGGSISAAVAMADGRVAIAGNFTSVAAQPRTNLAAFLPSGSLDAAFGTTAGTNAPVTLIAPRAAGGILLAGNFTLAGGARHDYVAAVAADGTVSSGFAGQAAVPKAMRESSAGKVVLMFDTTVVQLNADGTAAMTIVMGEGVRTGLQWTYAMGADSLGRVIVADLRYGKPSTVFAGPSIYEVVRYDPTGATDSSFPSMSWSDTTGGLPEVIDCGIGGSVALGGVFTAVSGTPGGGLLLILPSQLTNLSTLAAVPSSDFAVYGGWSIGGTKTKATLVRGIGPQLSQFGVAGPMADPELDLYASTGTATATSTHWAAALAPAFSSVGAFPLPDGSADAALITMSPAGPSTAQVSSVSGRTGSVLMELYDADLGNNCARLVNLSSRAAVSAGGPLVAGFVVNGGAGEKLLVRGITAGLASFGVGNLAQGPTLTLYDSGGAAIASQHGWGSMPAPGASAAGADLQLAEAATMAAVGAFSLATGSEDCAFVVTVPPGSYTAQVTTGVTAAAWAMVEIYEIR